MHALETKKKVRMHSRKVPVVTKRAPVRCRVNVGKEFLGSAGARRARCFYVPSETASYPNIENAVYGCGGGVGGVILGTVLRCHVFDCSSNLKLGDQHFLENPTISNWTLNVYIRFFGRL